MAEPKPKRPDGKTRPSAHAQPLLDVQDMRTYFPIRSGFLQRVIGHVKAVDGLSFQLQRATTLGLVGESGCGKTTVGRTLLRLHNPSGGRVFFDGRDIFTLNKAELRTLRPKMQIIFQDPYSSLSPRLPVGEIIGEAVREHQLVSKDAYEDHLDTIMQQCGLQPHHKARYPHEFSGGQRQRINIARALALEPEFVVCDEPVSALDVSIQAQIINLLMDLQENHQLTYLFISHDLSVVRHISQQIGIMYLGKLVEYGTKEAIFENPLHPYTQALLSAIPVSKPGSKSKRIVLKGALPSAASPPTGCKFHTRCAYCMSVCKTQEPENQELEPGHLVACHLYDQGKTQNEKKPCD